MHLPNDCGFVYWLLKLGCMFFIVLVSIRQYILTDAALSANFTGTLYQRQGDNRYFMDEKMTVQANICPAKHGGLHSKLHL